MVIKTAKRIVIFVIGMSVLVIGVAMVVLPGPAIIVMPAGLAILATEFAWAKKFLRGVRRKIQGVTQSGKKSEVLPALEPPQPPQPPDDAV